jgi:hypothetical protein
MNNTPGGIYNKLYRMGFAAGGVILGLAFLGPVFAAAAPFLPLIAAILAGLFAGLLTRGIFNAMVNKKLNRSYRHSAGPSADPSAADASAGQEPPKREPPPPPPESKVMYRKLLGLDETYTQNELKAAYRDCAAKFHPDRYVNADERERRRAEEMMKNINEAYHALL